MTPDEILRVYGDLADLYDRQAQPKHRDWFLVLAADAALNAGQAAEADRMLTRLLGLNPHHFLKPFPSFAEALRSPDVQGYVGNLRRNYPPDKAEQLLRAEQRKGRGEGPEREQVLPPPAPPRAFVLPPPSAAPPPDAGSVIFARMSIVPTGDPEERPTELDQTLGAPPPPQRPPAPPEIFQTLSGPAPPTRPEPPPRPIAPPPFERAPVPLPMPRPKPLPRPPQPAAAPPPTYELEVDPEPPRPKPKRERPPAPPRERPSATSSLVPLGLFVLLLLLGLGLAGYAFLRPFLPPEWLP